jgi:plastocyanin
MLAQSIILGSLAAIASAANLNVQVSDDKSTLVFTPPTTEASVGDVVTFHFYPKNHDVVQGSLEKPCAPLAGGFFSGFIPSAAGEANKTFSVTVKDDKPIWFYCSQGKHCNNGMAGVINPP